jgi:hypothetical protein
MSEHTGGNDVVETHLFYLWGTRRRIHDDVVLRGGDLIAIIIFVLQ